MIESVHAAALVPVGFVVAVVLLNIFCMLPLSTDGSTNSLWQEAFI